MTNDRYFAIGRALLVLPLILATTLVCAQAKKSKYTCTEPDPQSLCTAAITCGSATAPCEVDVKRGSYTASATPGIPGAKGNSLFCIAPGTKVTWKSTAKNTGFVVDMSDASPFSPGGAIIGGSDRTVSVVAQKTGCYKFSVGACVSGALSGMCANGSAELIIK